jgi:hypothetical protein
MSYSFKNIIVYSIMLIALALVVVPAQAFSASHIDYSISPNGDASVTADYELTFLEKIALSTDFAKGEFETALKNEYGDDVKILSITESNTQFLIPGFADIRDGNLITPCLNFGNIKDRVEKYWFMKYLSVDYTPTLTTVRFPNGETHSYNDELFVPSLSSKI